METKDGQAVASSKYQLYGATKFSTDETGKPYNFIRSLEAGNNDFQDYTNEP